MRTLAEHTGEPRAAELLAYCEEAAPAALHDCGGDHAIGVIPAAGAGRIQPLGCSKELLPVGSRVIDGVGRPKAISEYLLSA